jgi:cytoskeletal protein RodZ
MIWASENWAGEISASEGHFAQTGIHVGQFGDKFRKAREKKGISLDDASNVTKIGSRMLQAIEEEHFDQLPGGVFNKGFIRAYAKHLGINDQEAVSEYLDCLRQEQVRAQAVWEPQERSPKPEKRPPAAANSRPAKTQKPTPPVVQAPAQTAAQTEELPGLQLPKAEHVRPSHQKYLGRENGGIPWRLVAAAVIVLLLVVVLWRRHVIRESEASAATNAASTTTTSAPTNSTAPTSHAATPSLNAMQTAPANRSTATAAKPAPAASDSGDDQVITRAFGNSPALPAKPVAPLTLVIRATENSYISVSADGKTVTQETLIAPANTSVRATREIVARVGNAAGVTFLWDGKEIPAEGVEGEAKTFIFDAQGMRVAGTNQSPAQN